MSTALVNLGRILMAVIFLRSGYRKITGFDATADRLADRNLPFPEILLVGAIVFEILGALMIATGFRPRFGALLLIVFLIPVTLIFHPFTDPQQQTQFFKNLAILGGLAVVAGSAGRSQRDH